MIAAFIDLMEQFFSLLHTIIIVHIVTLVLVVTTTKLIFVDWTRSIVS